MKELNAWEISFYSKVFTDINDITDAIKNGEIKSFDIRDSYTPGDEINNSLDQQANAKNCIIHYTDSEHPFVFSNIGIVPSVINSKFFLEHKNEIINALTDQITNSKDDYFTIKKYFYTPKLLDILLEKKDIYLDFIDVDLTQDEIKRLKENHVDAYLEKNGKRERISSSFVFETYKFENIKDKKSIIINFDELDKIDVDDFKYLAPSVVISINYYGNKNIGEEERLRKIRDFIEKIDLYNKNAIVKFEIEKRSNFTKVFGDDKFNNIDIGIINDGYGYSYEEYMAEEEKLEELVRPIKEKDFSPLEKYFAVYNIVKKYKKYKESDNKNESRYLRHILENDYMVCVGFAKLLSELCDRVGINCKELSISVDTSYDAGFTVEEKPIQLTGHARNIVSIDDDKYNVHGLYVADATWDNFMNISALNNALMPFDKMDVARRLVSYSFNSPILDIHNFKEFNDQVNFLFKRHLQELMNKKSKTTFHEKLLSTYQNVTERILDTINCDPEYANFYNKMKLCKEENDYLDYLTELGNYLLTRINKKVDDETILKASLLTDKELGKAGDNPEKHEENTRKLYHEIDVLSFPYEMESVDNHELGGRSR